MSALRLSAELQSSAPIFAALGDKTRAQLVARLCAGKPLSITQLSAGTRVTRQAVTRHLHVLAGAGIVRGSRRGREQLWELSPPQLLAARRCLDLISRQWDEALSRLKSLVEKDDSA
jgi:DNA-binding transcriptional ArsR family regulator